VEDDVQSVGVVDPDRSLVLVGVDRRVERDELLDPFEYR